MIGNSIERKVRRIVGINGDLELAVESLNSRRTEYVFNRREAVEPHLSHFRRRNHQARKHVAILLLFRQQLNGYRVLLVFFLVSRDLIFTGNHQPDRACNVRGAHAKVGGALAVDLYLKLRIVEAHRRLDVEQPGHLSHSRGELLRELCRLLNIGAKNQSANWKEGLAAAQRRWNDYLAAQVLILASDLANLGGYLEIR